MLADSLIERKLPDATNTSGVLFASRFGITMVVLLRSDVSVKRGPRDEIIDKETAITACSRRPMHGE
jgi:hypothetical protein